MRKILAFVLILFSFTSIQASNPTLGILGDSNSDEYRADDNRAGGTPYELTTLNWVELLTKYRGIDTGVWGNYSEPRRSGYAFNWARSASLSCDILNQANGLAGQGVEYAVIFTGTNDFHTWNSTYDEIYNGSLSDAALQNKVNSIVGCITTAVNTLENAGVLKIVLVNLADPSPFFAAQFPDATKRQRVTNAINSINSQLNALVINQSIKLADLNAFTVNLLSHVINGQLPVGSEQITLTSLGDEPHHFRLAATVGHLGTVANGLLANFLLSVLRQYGFPAQDFSDSELLVNAGIGVATPTNTPTLTATATLTPAPSDTPQPSVTPSETATIGCTVTLTATATLTPSRTATPTPTNTPTATVTPTATKTPTATVTPTATPAPKTVRLVSRPNSPTQFYAAFDGIVEDSVFTEVNSARFGFSPVWLFYPTGGRNSSAVYASITNGWQVSFSTSAHALIVQTFSSPAAGYLDIYVNNVLKLSYKNNAANAPVDVVVPLG